MTLTLATSAKLYAGQTSNMSIRMASDQGYLVAMGVARILLCFQHDIHNVYHKDALEVALIAYNFITMGLGQINKSPFANNWYNNIRPDIDVDNISPADYFTMRGWTAWRYALLVGTAPPEVMFNREDYQELLRHQITPDIDFDVFRVLRGGGLHNFLTNLGTDIFPTFIDHYPNRICDRMHDWSPSFSVQDITNGDERLLEALQERGASVAVMLGHRPTRLSAEAVANYYWDALGGKLTACRLPNGRQILLLWVPHPSVERRMFWQPETFKRIFHLVELSVNVLEKGLYDLGIGRIGSQGFGVTETQAERILSWYSDSSLGRQLRAQVMRFLSEWNAGIQRHTQTEPASEFELLIGKVQKII